MRNIVRCALYAGLFSGSLFFLTESYAAADDADRAKESVERQQKIELQQFYAGKGGRVPVLPVAIGLYNDAVKFFEKGEYDMARQAVEDALDLEPRNAPAWELRGEIENLQQDFEKAEAYYKKSYLLSPSPRLREKIEKLQKEKTVEDKLGSFDEEHFIIKFEKGQEDYSATGLKNLLREVYRQVSQDFGYYFNHKTVVLFYNSADFHNLTGKGHWVGGMYDGKIRLPAFRKGLTDTELRAVVTHEMTHAFIAAISSMRAPSWLHEGLAEYEANKVRPVDLLVFNAAVKTNTLMPVQEILSSDLMRQNPDPLLLTLFYQESFRIVSYIMERYRMYRMKEVLEKFKEGKSAEEAIEEVLGVSPGQLEKEWLATIPKN
ncbi:MAG TPA: peptidase MA family metallohydrolase [Candidatus Omnitrophota bacterium]|nr:peptidase MA family metallohydrolase [Candidatus Omnitrophota bacterium]HPS37453.1 peptidase MA family metallohydrolase [Candidatus Omnitrophota bacterium]